MNRSRLSSNRESAGTRSPAISSTMSPGTSWSIGTEQACAVAPYGCLDCHRPAQRLNRILSANFLDEIECYADRDDGNDDDEARDVAGRRGQPARHEQDDDQRIAEAGEELQPKWRTFDRRGVVGSIGRQPRLHLCGTQGPQESSRAVRAAGLFGSFQISSGPSSPFSRVMTSSRYGPLASRPSRVTFIGFLPSMLRFRRTTIWIAGRSTSTPRCRHGAQLAAPDRSGCCEGRPIISFMPTPRL